jgi:nitrile hydratase accessory protein
MSELPELPKLPWNKEEGPVFKAPWEASAFAMTVRLFEQGHFTWPEWTERLSAEIGAARKRGEPDLGDRYYEYWLSALEKLIVATGLGTEEQLGQLKEDWTEATLSTPHGQPIELKNRPPVE